MCTVDSIESNTRCMDLFKAVIRRPLGLCLFVAGRRPTFESESDSNSMDDVEPDSDGDKDYDSDKDPAWRPHANASATPHVCPLDCVDITIL